MSRHYLALGLLVALAACGSSKSPPRNLDDACALTRERPQYLRAMRATERKWDVPVPVQMAAAVLAVATGVAAWRAYQRVKGPLGRAEQVLIANEVTPLNAAVGELGLTARELEVLEAVLEGSIGDSEIAERLYVSPATAATHVRSIMSKADAKTRRDLLTLLPDDPSASP